MKVLITGGAGYLGSHMAIMCAQRGLETVVIDDMSYGDDAVKSLRSRGASVVPIDVTSAVAMDTIREMKPDQVFHLASIVGDPECAKQPERAKLVNITATKAALEVAAEVGAFSVFPSSCSVYGKMPDDSWVDESSPTNPVSLYAEQKLEIERFIKENELPAAIMRLSTLHGLSPKMRFDLTVNEFIRGLYLDGKIDVYGEQFWRPYLHVYDASLAMTQAAWVESPGDIKNVGRNDFNFRKGNLAYKIQTYVGKGEINWVKKDEDPRDYRVKFDAITNSRRFSTPSITPQQTAVELLCALDAARCAGMS